MSSVSDPYLPRHELSALRLADERMTAERDEIKYLVPRDHLDALAADLTRRLPAHRFTGEGANRLPDPHHFVTTIYFDTPSRALYRMATSQLGHNAKIRAKEYYDLHPSLAELATDPTQIVRYQPWLWFELKRRDESRTTKRRFRIRKTDIPAFFAEGRVSKEVVVLPELKGGGGYAAPARALDEGVSEIVAFCRGLGEPLSASCLVSYRRLSWQALDGSLRVTLDLGLSYFRPPPHLWVREQALVRGALGPVCGGLDEAVLEVKYRSAAPSWLDEALANAGVMSASFSKFVAAQRAVDG